MDTTATTLLVKLEPPDCKQESQMVETIFLPNLKVEANNNSDSDIETLHSLKNEEIVFKDEDTEEQDVTQYCTTSADETESNTFKCELCVYTGSKVNNLQRHMVRKHKESPIKCNMCDYSSYNILKVNRHMECHSDDKPFKCELCDYSTTRKRNLRSHNQVHIKEKPYVCDQCDYKCSTRTYLSRHKRLHTNKLHTCEKCGFYTHSKYNFLNHVKTHLSTRNKQLYSCSICPYTAVHKFSLKKHEQTHVASEKRYRCDKCTFSDTNISLLVEHMKTH